MKFEKLKRYIIPCLFLILCLIYLIGVKANFTRTTYIPNILYPFKIILFWTLVIFNLLFLTKWVNAQWQVLLLFFNLFGGYLMILELQKPDLHRGWLYKDVMISKMKHDKELNIKYRLRAENFRQSNRTFFVEFFPISKEGEYKKIELPELNNIVEGFLMYVNDEDFYRGKNGERLIPSTVEFILKSKNDSLILTTSYNTKEIVAHTLNLSRNRAEYLNKKTGYILNDTVRVYGKPIDSVQVGENKVYVYKYN